ncbi:methyltransferase domain-containing protein [Mycobacteroides abscessus]|uniref:methyltransferase domain-containing protein n=1 Tax=Mycobacteroides abscessus TaxID=36809 RepID=UPI003CC5A125
MESQHPLPARGCCAGYRLMRPTFSDVGCGIGMLTRELAPLAQRVSGSTPTNRACASPRAETSASNVEYVAASFLEHPFPA